MWKLKKTAMMVMVRKVIVVRGFDGDGFYLVRMKTRKGG